MERKIGKSSLRDCTIATGVSVDKVLALQGQSPVGVQIANIVMPTEEEREARRRVHHALGQVTRDDAGTQANGQEGAKALRLSVN